MADAERVDVLYTLAVAQRYQSRHDDALQTIESLIDIEPGYGRAHQERGHTLLALGRDGEACQAFEHAVRCNPSLPASWNALLALYRDEPASARMREAQQQAQYLSMLPPELLAVSSMLHEGKLYKADRLCRSFLRDHKHHIEAMRLLAAIGDRTQRLADADFLLESCVEFAPQYDTARYDYANLLLKMQKFEAAYHHTGLLVERDPDNLAYRSLHGNATAGIGDHERAIQLYNSVLDQSPSQPMLLVMRGHAEKTIGRLDDAVRSYRHAFGLQPDYGDAFWSLANTKTYRFTDAEIAHMQHYERAAATSEDDRVHLGFALGKAFEDRGDYARSFEYYERGNRLKHASIRHRPEHLAIRTGAQQKVCTRKFFDSKAGVGHPASDPIFIVGMPRAGSTLLEQILSSHSLVDGTHELPNIIALAQRLRGSPEPESAAGGQPGYPEILAELEDDYFRRFGEQFIDATHVYRGNAPYFIDKNPNNFFHIGLIKLILPNARVIDARRHPMACCFSGFKQLFGQGQEFSYGLVEIGNYYREYVELMDHWDAVLPGFVLRVQHEDVVNDTDAQVARVLEFCGLPFEAACLEFYNTERSIRTPSSEQVRQPIYRTGLEYWRNFEPWLTELKDALGPEVRGRYGIGHDGAPDVRFHDVAPASPEPT
jgi:tetratricopeptide (TPR) repeat protein